jgi:hypothetical protein
MTRVKQLASAILDGNNDITFSGPHANNALAGYVSSGTYVYANETLAKDACKARIDCNGVTRQTSQYTLRAGSTLTDSSNGENSWQKTPTFTSHAGMALAGYVSSGTYAYANETLAKDACKARVDCNGVTLEPKNYTLRAGSLLLGSYKGEVSWKKVTGFIRKVRVQSVHSSQTNSRVNLKEVQVFDRNGNNVALNKTATQSGTEAGGAASNAVNGNVTDFGSKTTIQTTSSKLLQLSAATIPYIYPVYTNVCFRFS